jgi:hypothetical protein
VVAASDQLCGTWQTRQVGKIVDPLDPWRNGATLAVEPDAAQPDGAGGKCIGLELVTDVDHRMQWHIETTAGQPGSSYFGVCPRQPNGPGSAGRRCDARGPFGKPSLPAAGWS